MWMDNCRGSYCANKEGTCYARLFYAIHKFEWGGGSCYKQSCFLTVLMSVVELQKNSTNFNHTANFNITKYFNYSSH